MARLRKRSKKWTTAVSRLVTKSATWPDARNVVLLAFGAETAALHIQALLAPHIAEESDKKMDELEAVMAKEDQQVRDDLDRLAAIHERLKRRPGSRHGLIELRPVQRDKGPNSRSFAREHQRSIGGHLAESEAQGDASLPRVRWTHCSRPSSQSLMAGVDYGRFGRPIKRP